jgi:hypothetical protein
MENDMEERKVELPLDRRPMLLLHQRGGDAALLVNSVPDYSSGSLVVRRLDSGQERHADGVDFVEHFPCWEAQQRHRRRVRCAAEFLVVELLSLDMRRVTLRRRLLGVEEEQLADGCWAYYDTNGDERAIVRPPFRLLTEPMWDPAEEIQF